LTIIGDKHYQSIIWVYILVQCGTFVKLLENIPDHSNQIVQFIIIQW